MAAGWLAARASPRALIVTANGPTFSAGGDVDWFKRGTAGGDVDWFKRGMAEPDADLPAEVRHGAH